MKNNFSDRFLMFTSDGGNNYKGMTDYHYHEQTELYFLLSGDCRYFIGNKIYSVTPGQLVIIPAFMIHKTIYNAKNRKRTLISLKKDFLDFEPMIDITKQSIYSFAEKAEAEVKRILDKIHAELETRDEFSEKMCRCLCFELFTLISREGREITAKQKSADAREENRTVEKITSYITEQYMENITLADVAEKVGLSEGHISRLFKSITGLGFKEYLITVRILNAKKLLRETELPVARIAFDCGFNDSNYFSKMFRQYSEYTPLQYRKKRGNIKEQS